MPNMKLSLYLALRLLQVFAVALVVLFGAFIALALLDTPHFRALGGVWFDFLGANLSTSAYIGGGALALAFAVGGLLDRLGRRWRRELGKYR
jgi:hypothetical protein